MVVHGLWIPVQACAGRVGRSSQGGGRTPEGGGGDAGWAACPDGYGGGRQGGHGGDGGGEQRDEVGTGSVAAHQVVSRRPEGSSPG